MKKVLIITYYWPPAGGAGVQRVLKFAKYLPQFGWQPVILTVNNPDAPIYDESLKIDIPKECIVYHSDKWEPFDLYKKFTGKKENDTIPADVMLTKKNASFKDKAANWIRTNVFIPDAKIGWIPYGVKKGLEIIEKENIDLIFSTSPPQTVGIIAKKIAAKSGLKWIADFRDPWMEIVYYQKVKRSWLTKKIDGNLELGVLKSANALISVSTDIIRLFKEKIGRGNFKVIPNGYDETDFNEVVDNTNNKFTISYTGALSADRIPYPLLNAMERLKDESITDFHLVLAGRNCTEFDELVEEKNLTDFVEKKGYLTHKESTKVLQTSDILLLVVDDVPDNKGFLTGKIFEYFGCRKPIFAIGPVDGNANDLIKEANCGKMVDYKDDEGAYHLLKSMYNNWKSGIDDNKYNTERFSRKNLTKELAEFFESTVNN